MQPDTTLILAALEVEARAAAAALGVPFGRGLVLRTAPPGPVVEIDTVGMRASRLDAVVLRLNESSRDGNGTGRVPRVFLVGLAGALDPALRVGDLVVDCPAAVEGAGACPPFPADLPCRAGRIHTADRIVATPAEKKALFEDTGALAVDMEQSLVRAALAPLGLEVIGLRAISDAADTALPPALPQLVDSLGRPKPGALAAHLLRRPALAVELARLGRASSLATRNLQRGIRHLLGLPAGRGNA